MIRYDFVCNVCERSREISMDSENSIKVGKTVVNTDEKCVCGNMVWRRVWGDKSASFKLNFRQTSI